MARAALGGVGLGGLKSLTSVSRVDGRGITNSMSILVDRKEGAALLGPGRPARYGCLAFAPKQSFYVNCSSIDVGKFHAMARGFPDPWFQQAFGLRFKQDLVDLLGPEMALIVAPNQGLVPDIGFAFESKDAAHLARSLLKMAKAIRWPAGTGIQRAKILGVAAHVLPLGHPRLAEIPIAPTFGVVDGRLLIAPSPLAFRRFVAVQQGRQPNLSANRDFAKLRELVPERAEGLSYLNLPRLVGFAYDTAVPFLQAMPQPAGAGPLYQLPESDVFTRHLYGRIAWMVTDERGMHWVSHSPLDMSGFLLGGIGAGVGAWVTLARQPEAPVPIRADAQDLEAMMCEDRVRRLSTWLRYYRRQHKALPASLDDLKSEDRSDDSFLVPGTKRGYVYFGPKGRNGVLLHGFANGRDKRVCILTRGMKVRRVTAKQLSEMLAKRSASRDR